MATQKRHEIDVCMLFSALSLSGKNLVHQGDPIRLSCNATGVQHAPEDVDWFFKGLKIQNSVQQEIIITKFLSLETRTLLSILEIERSKMNDSGIYICRSTDLMIKTLEVTVLSGKCCRCLNVTLISFQNMD
jgi:hypothetical protein